MEKELRCNRCGWKWAQRGKEKPLVCPSCKSKKWNVFYNNSILDMIFKK